MSTSQSPRGGTRARIIEVALELFSEQGYEGTSLREIADRLGVTKAALYYHFKTKDDIVHGIVESMAAPIDATIAWGELHTWSPEVRDELIRRFAAGAAERAPLLRFFHENQPALRDSPSGLEFKKRMGKLVSLVHGPGAGFEDRLRATMALFSVNSAFFVLKNDLENDLNQPNGCTPGGPEWTASVEAAMAAALTVALENSARIHAR
ncbi:TetR/AcrR family transcriptional regulator [Kitasatospora sp. GAS204B]|uniref:TetR/AcrR family transcriptional regulator n=1 Tax=unclassified Kitasatospora TaxID=2633591 RepID=UPI002476A51D|nr:TetR/AcrR family transcriptional regulator [Kitasatospora sp. GAS204B]MDH6116776.1 AcrR family transcriptional regulator [Kitasatospora sp. GAS204B]